MKIKCFKCSKIAVYYYLPRNEDEYYCEDCISRGCSCQCDFDTDEYLLDDLGRKLPCVEYDYSEFGYDNDDWEKFLEDVERAGYNPNDCYSIDEYVDKIISEKK